MSLHAAAAVPECPTYEESLQALQSLQYGQDVPAPDPACSVYDSLLAESPRLVAEGVFGPWVEDAKAALVDVTRTMTTFWVGFPDPTLSDGAGNPSATVGFLWNSTGWLAAALLVGAIIWSGIKIILGGGTGAVRDMGRLMFTTVAVQTVAITVIVGLLELGDGFSQWVIEKSTEGTSFADNLIAALTAPLGSGLLTVFLLLLAALVSLAQVVIMIGRGAALIVLTGTLLVTASVVNTEAGAAAFRKQCGWVLSFILLKPVAAIIYAAGFRLLGESPTTPTGVLQIAYGLCVLILAVMTLPVLMRLITPMVAPASQGRGAGMAAVGLVATGVTAGKLAKK